MVINFLGILSLLLRAFGGPLYLDWTLGRHCIIIMKQYRVNEKKVAKLKVLYLFNTC